MNGIQVKTGRFTPSVRIVNRIWFKTLLIFYAGFGLSGCASTRISPLAPTPPEIRFSSLYYEEQAAQSEAFRAGPDQEKRRLKPSDFIALASGIGIEPSNTQNLDKKANGSSECRVQNRFDRESVIAYEWGENRLGLNVSGVNLGGSDDQVFKIVYKLRLQPEKTKAQRCRYASHWQGLIGSSYNEFFIREDDTIYQQFRDIRQNMQKYMDDRL